MSHELQEGVKLHSIWWAEGSLTVSNAHDVVSITVRDQNGQMGMVPWVEVVNKDGRAKFFNCAQLEGFEVAV